MKVLRVLAKVLLGIIVFIFFLLYVAIPVGVPWAVSSQGSKLLKHPVRMGTVWVNPFLMRVSVNGLHVYEADKKEVIAGFDRFWADLSFLKLFQKEYRVESIGLENLVVNAVLLPDGSINLASLAPAPAASAQPPAQPDTSERAAAQSLPKAVIDKVLLSNAAISFTDRSVTPEFVTRLSGMNLTVTNVSTDPESIAKAVFATRLDEKGTIAVEALFKPLKQPLELETSFSLNNYALDVLTPYVGKFTGRAVKSGKMDLKMDYKIAGNKINARHRLLIQKFDFGKKVESKDALPLPFGLAVAILEDPQGRIDFTVPVTGDMSSPEFNYWRLLGQVGRNFLVKLVASPFLSIASMMGAESGTEESGFVAFAPGSAALDAAGQEKLQAAVKLLQERPKLSLEINGSYDPADDWKQLKTSAFEARYQKMRQESSRSDVRLITQIYKEKFGMRSYDRLARKFRSGATLDETALETEMKRLIIEEGAPDIAALETLARQRAQLVYDAIIASGFDATRVSMGPVRQTKASMGLVPLEFTLTVFEKEQGKDQQ